MDVMEAIAARIRETENRAVRVVQDLERLGTLQESLGSAKSGLVDASKGVANLASAANDVVKSLCDAARALRETVDMVRKSDPELVKDALERTEAQSGRMSEQLENLGKRVTSHLRDMPKLTLDMTQNRHEDTRRRLGGLESRVQQLQESVSVSVQELGDKIERVRKSADEGVRAIESMFDRKVGEAVEGISRQNVLDRVLGRPSRKTRT